MAGFSVGELCERRSRKYRNSLFLCRQNLLFVMGPLRFWFFPKATFKKKLWEDLE